MTSTTFEEAYQIARERSSAEQEVVAVYVQHALANRPVSPEDASTLRGLKQALRGEGYSEEEARARMEARIGTASA